MGFVDWLFGGSDFKRVNGVRLVNLGRELGGWQLLDKGRREHHTDDEVVALRKANGLDPYCEHGRVCRQYGHWCHEPKGDSEWNQFFEEKEQIRKENLERIHRWAQQFSKK